MTRSVEGAAVRSGCFIDFDLAGLEPEAKINRVQGCFPARAATSLGASRNALGH